MLGLAKDLFKQGAVSLDDFAFSVKTEKPWPTVQSLLQSGYLSFVDYSFARAVLGQIAGSDEEQACFLAVMMAFSRQGHLCITIQDGQIFPSLQSLSPVNEEEVDIKHIEEMLVTGAENLSQEIYDQGIVVDSLKPLVKDGQNFYLQRNYFLEVSLAKEIGRILQFPAHEGNGHDIPDILNDCQRIAIDKALVSPLMLITGGPGTGKTFTATHFLACYLKNNPEARVAIAAPTGKAISHLKRKIIASKALEPFQNQLQVGTLHSLLGVKQADDLIRKDFHLSADCILIDECSMIDLALFSALLRAVPENAKLILMGDDHQLPPIESGTVFSEICHYAKESHPSIISTLKVCQRSDQKEILDLSDDIRRGDALNVSIALKANHCGALTYHPLGDISQEWEKGYFPAPFDAKPDCAELFATIDSFRILTPIRKGPYGIEEINRRVWSYYFQKVRSNQYWAIPIIITKTSYQLDLCNGEMGYLVRFVGRKNPNSRQLERQDYAVFVDKQASGYREIPAALLPAFENAYALSVHKSQGSEYDTLVFCLPPGSENFGREILYTGVTRAKHSLTLYAEEETIQKCLSRESKRNSALSMRLLAQ